MTDTPTSVPSELPRSGTATADARQQLFDEAWAKYQSDVAIWRQLDGQRQNRPTFTFRHTCLACGREWMPVNMRPAFVKDPYCQCPTSTAPASQGGETPHESCPTCQSAARDLRYRLAGSWCDDPWHAPAAVSREDGGDEPTEQCPNRGLYEYARCLLPVGHPGECITDGRPSVKYVAFFRVVAQQMAAADRLLAQLTASRSRVAALEADAERLDWLNEDADRLEEVFGATVRNEQGGAIRAIIDAARSPGAP